METTAGRDAGPGEKEGGEFGTAKQKIQAAHPQRLTYFLHMGGEEGVLTPPFLTLEAVQAFRPAVAKVYGKRKFNALCFPIGPLHRGCYTPVEFPPVKKRRKMPNTSPSERDESKRLMQDVWAGCNCPVLHMVFIQFALA